MSTEEWLQELCPEIAEWQVEVIAEHIEGVTRTAYNQGFVDGHTAAEKLADTNSVDDVYQQILKTAREATK